MIKLVAFDVDNTLAITNENIKRENVLLIRQIIDRGIKVMILSGKPSSYLAGFARMIGRPNIIISGENGCDLSYGFEFPPRKYYQFPLSELQKSGLQRIKDDIVKMDLKVFFQPNMFGVTPFFLDETSQQEIEEYAKTNESSLDGIDVYYHNDCIDFTPNNVSKGKALRHILDELEISIDEVIAVGDSSNDVSMLELVSNPFIIGDNIKIKKATHFKSINEALLRIVNLLNE